MLLYWQTKTAEHFTIKGLEKALEEPNTDVRIFGKPTTRPYRRMGVALVHDDLNADIITCEKKQKKLPIKFQFNKIFYGKNKPYRKILAVH